MLDKLIAKANAKLHMTINNVGRYIVMGHKNESSTS
jgi:hypothetical protein